MNNFMRRVHHHQNLYLHLQYCRRQCMTNASNAVTAAAAATETESCKRKPSYEEVIGRRHRQAQRSIVVQVSSEKSYTELYNYCSNFGRILSTHHYANRHDDEHHYLLLEYENAEEAQAAIDAAAYNADMSGVPVRSPFVWFKAATAGSKRSAKITNATPPPPLPSPPPPPLATLDGTRRPGNDQISSLLCNADNIEQQILRLHDATQLNELGIRIRFLAALQVEQAVSGMFPAAQAQPFGSSVNGFGRMGCDLDLILRFDRHEPHGTKGTPASRLIYHTKENLSNGRTQTQRQMECIGDLLHLFLPGICHVRRILQARVPIIKYHHEHLNLEVDLSMSNLTGFYMSELLYMFGELDSRVRPLTFTIRRWAQSCGLTNPSPGRWITNFSLTCLVMYFLQQLRQPILPSIGLMIKSANTNDIRITEDGINCTFARDVQRIGFHSSGNGNGNGIGRNTSNLGQLLLQFFEFYSQFDFHNRAISLNEAKALAKPEHAAMYIVNPFEPTLNVSKNVSLEECERLRIEVRNAAWILESEVDDNANTNSNTNNNDVEANEGVGVGGPWGLLNLFKHPEKAVIRPNMFFKPRMVDVSELFDNKNNNNADGDGDGEVSSTSASIPVTSIKNASVRQQVKAIKAAARADLKHMRGASTTTNEATTSTTTTTATTKSRRNR